MHRIVCAVMMVAAAGRADADTLHVPDDYPTIQAAIDAATDGDDVVIADGTHTGDGNTNLDTRGKAVTVRSVSGDLTACIMDCEVGLAEFAAFRNLFGTYAPDHNLPAAVIGHHRAREPRACPAARQMRRPSREHLTTKSLTRRPVLVGFTVRK